MDNSLVHSLEGYVVAIFTDLRPTYGSASDWERDKNRSLHELAVRGERFLTIDLPALRKHLERCLDEHQYTSKGLYLSALVSKTVQVPAFLRNLYLQVFDKKGKLLSEPNPCAVSDLRQLFEGFGKLKHPCSQEAIDAEVENFYTNEAELREGTLHWSDDALYQDVIDLRAISFSDLDRNSNGNGEPTLFGPISADAPRKSGDCNTLQEVCDIIASSFGDLHLERDDEYVAERPQHGRGRVSNLKKGLSKHDFSDWPAKLDRIFSYDRYAVPDFGAAEWIDVRGLGYRNREHPSKLIAVPKTMSGPRLIGSEPNYHQWIQQLIRAQIEARIKATPLRYCVAFGNQEPNRVLALQGSIDGLTATVDLKSASDRLSCWTVERAFRRNSTFLERIHASRTRTMRNAINGRFNVLRLKKCFTQGSACTFPVQTIVYSMLAIAAVLITAGTKVSTKSISDAARKCRVFGDDIIVPTTALPKLCELLSLNQLIVNTSKTFANGSFRESCGLDAFQGVDVTPARVKRFSCNPSHEVAQSMIEASNNFYRRGLWNVAYWIRSYLSELKLATVRFHDSDGYSCATGVDRSHLRKRWNDQYQRWEHEVHQLVSKSKRVPTQSAYDLMDFLSAKNPQRNPLDFLFPLERGVGVVDQSSSVMRRGWIPAV